MSLEDCGKNNSRFSQEETIMVESNSAQYLDIEDLRSQADFSKCKFTEINLDTEIFSRDDFLLEMDYSSLDKEDISEICGLMTKLVKLRKIALEDFELIHDLVTKSKTKTEHKIVEYVKTETNTIFIGDVHGVFNVILFHFMFNGCFDEGQRYVFLGDIVDRGSESLECFCFLMLLKLIYPNQIYLIRGNHESRNTYTTYGLSGEISSKFGADEHLNFYDRCDCYEKIDEMISLMAIAIIVDKKIFCVHGVPCEYTPDVRKLEIIPRNHIDRSENDDKVIENLLWSDPIDTDFFKSGISSRGIGREVPLPLIIDYLNQNNLGMIVRAHQCVTAGYELKRGRIMTIFGQPNYCGFSENNAAMLVIDSIGNQNVYTFTEKTMNSSFANGITLKEEPKIPEYFA